VWEGEETLSRGRLKEIRGKQGKERGEGGERVKREKRVGNCHIT